MFPVKNIFEEITSVNELLDYMNQNILYGWLDYDEIQLEHSNPLIPGIHEYANEKMALENVTQYYQNRDKGKNRRLDEFYDVPKGLSFKEFNEYLNQYDKIKSRGL
jgi:hypothetical protein